MGERRGTLSHLLWYIEGAVGDVEVPDHEDEEGHLVMKLLEISRFAELD